MSVEVPSGAGQRPDSVPIAESEGWSAPGVQVLVTGVVLLLAAIVLLVLGISLGANAAGPIALICVAVLLAISGHLALRGLTSVVAGEARVVQLFGRYRGTVRAAGLHWVNPFARGAGCRSGSATTRRRWPRSTTPTATRSRSPPWSSGRSTTRPRRSTRSTTSSSSWPSRPRPRSGTSRRAIPTRAGPTAGCRCATTPTRSPSACRPRSRPGSGSAGVTIIESRLTRLSYAPEIAQAMLRQQQASAVVGARTRIVEGAVGMVQLALQRLAGGGRGRTGRGAEGRHGVQPARGAVQRAGHPAGRQHRFPVPVTALPVTAGTVTR